MSVEHKKIGEIRHGMLVLVGISKADTRAQAENAARRLIELRIFRDESGKMNRDIRQTGGSLLVVSNFTLYADCRKGRRPSFDRAAKPQPAQSLYEHFVGQLRQQGLDVQTGIFGAEMQVSLVNDGPVTLILESDATQIEASIS